LKIDGDPGGGHVEGLEIGANMLANLHQGKDPAYMWGISGVSVVCEMNGRLERADSKVVEVVS
jgi:hypothetical protein